MYHEINITKYLRLANYLAAGQIYLRDNFLLSRPLTVEDIKPRLLGHWGTTPGISFAYAHLSQLAAQYGQEILFVCGPGHGLPALLANLYLEGTLGEFYPKYKQSVEGLSNLMHDFSWPGGFPSHANPSLPGVILEGGELGYSLGTAFGAAFDNPNLMVACLIGDGEAETGALAAAWQSLKFWNPQVDGSVLPIIHLNRFKISNPTVLGCMTDIEIGEFLSGMGYKAHFVKGPEYNSSMHHELEQCYLEIKSLRSQTRFPSETNKYPVLVIETPKGWTAPKHLDGKMLEGSFRSHQVPLTDVRNNPQQLAMLDNWLRSYRINELLDDMGMVLPEITSFMPQKHLLLGQNLHAGRIVPRDLKFPLENHKIIVDKPMSVKSSSMISASDYLRDITTLNPNNFRVFSPDESESNKLHSLVDKVKRIFMWPTPEGSENISPNGRVMEILSEQTLMAWMEGYILTGRNGVFVSYESFMSIVNSMLDQYSKFLRQANKSSWRTAIPSFNIILTSTGWRQDHNGFSHQNPSFVSNALLKKTDNINIHFPVDANSMIATLEDCFTKKNKINIIVAGKTDLPQYLTIEEAYHAQKNGISAWNWAGNMPTDPDIVFAATGDYITYEAIAALEILKEYLPGLKTRFVSVSELTALGIGDKRNPTRYNEDFFAQFFTKNKPVIYAYHGYPEDIEQLLFHNESSNRFYVHGYMEEGTTTTPFDMLVRNHISRYNLVLSALERLEGFPEANQLRLYCQEQLARHHKYIVENGEDMPEVRM